MLPEKLKIQSLQAVVENYIKWIQDNSYILRVYNQLEPEHLQQNGYWINIELNIPIKKGMFERSGEVVAISIYLTSVLVDIFIDILAARLNKVSYTSMICPVIADFFLGGIVYKYSGASSNLIDIGKIIDDLLSSKKISPLEMQSKLVQTPFFSSVNLAKFILCSLALSNAMFFTLGYWQSIISMRNQFEESHIDDPILTPELITDLAIISAIVYLTYFEVFYTSFALKATDPLKTFLDSCYNIFSSCISSIKVKHYSGILTEEEQIENDEIKSDNIYYPRVTTITSSFNIIKPLSSDEEEATIFFITDVIYDNLLLNVPNLLFEVFQIGGTKAAQNIINLGKDFEVASIIIECIEQYGIKHVIQILFSNAIESYKAEVDLPDNQIIIITEDESTKKYSEKLIVLELKEVTDQIIEQNFFLNNERGREFIKAVASNFDENTLIAILGLGIDQNIAEQILDEAEIQGIEKVIYTLLGKELPVAGTADNLKNVIGEDELSQLQLIPNGILNSWSNKAYYKIADYIDNLAKNLDDMLNTGKSGNQVASTITLLEEWLGFAASGQRFIGAAPLYYNPNNDDWSNDSGGGGSSRLGGSNSSSDNNSNGFTDLILPSYNGTDSDINHQM